MRQFGRYAELVFKDFTLNSDNLTIEFDVPFDDDSEPNESVITVYNLSKDSLNRLKHKAPITLNAGYKGDIGVILSGFITKVETRMSGADKVTTIYAWDGPTFDAKTVESKTYKAGIKANQIIEDLMKRLGIPKGSAILPINKVYREGYTVEGSVTEILSNVAKDCGATFWVSKGKWYIRSINSFKDVQFVLSPDTGLIGSPSPFEEEINEKATLKGYNVNCLLQHRIGTASVVQLDSRDVKGVYQVRKGVHYWNGSSFYTEMEVI